MAAVDVRELRRQVERYAQDVERAAADRLLRQLEPRLPRVSGKMAAESSRKRADTTVGSRHQTRIVQEAGAPDRPEALPNWLDQGVSFPIRARRARMLRFRGDSGRIIFRREVQWNKSRRSRGFWSDVFNEGNWEEALRAEAQGRSLPGS